MLQLEANECRVLGVLVEKALTTPGQYPMTLNAMVNGCNQKSNRLPVLTMDEDDVFDTVETLRRKELVREVMMSGSRVAKYRHVARETLDVETAQLVLLTELMLRGPQTLGELRGRASRMHSFETMDDVQSVLQGLMDRQPPLVRSAPPAPGSRAGRFAQLLCPDLHRIGGSPVVAHDAGAVPATHVSPPATGSAVVSAAFSGDRDQLDRLSQRVAALEQTVASLQAELASLKAADAV